MSTDDNLDQLDNTVKWLIYHTLMSHVGEDSKTTDECGCGDKAKTELNKETLRIALEIIGEDYKHSNGQPMKNPAYECPECGEPNLEWSLNIFKQTLRKAFEDRYKNKEEV